MPDTISCDVAIVGGGLSGCLFALALARWRPDARVKLIERGVALGGNHLWSFFATDIADGDRWLVAPLVSHEWGGYDIAFPGRSRRIDTGYSSIGSERLDAVVRAALPAGAVMLNRRVLAASPTAVVLADGDRVEAKGVIDCRGPGDLRTLEVGWQKFLGREFLLDEPHGITRPTIMDATVAQIDGYRFVYTLPFSANRMFVEDTYYSDTPGFDRATVSSRIDDYVAARGWRPTLGNAELREEAGALPVVIGGDFEAYWHSGGNKVAKGGARAALFHPTTGYSLPDAVRAAVLVAGAGDLSGAALHALLHGHARAAWRARGFYRMLDVMLFRAATPDERRGVLQRFYGLDAGLIARFYASRSTMWDKARVLMGKPPVPISHALRALRDARLKVAR